MTSFWKSFFKKKKKKIKITDNSESAVIYLNPDIEAYKLFDCVILESRYTEIQDSIRNNVNPEFDAFYDMGIVIGSSSKLNNYGIPQYYIVGWYNPETPEKPVLEKLDHDSLIPVIRPLSELNDRSEYLNRMFRAFFMNWLDLYNHENAPKN